MRLAVAKGKDIRYKRHGEDRTGMDPNHYVHWTFARIGWEVPSDIEVVARMGKEVREAEALRSGDVLFFATKKKGEPSFMGIYRGKGEFASILPLKGERGKWTCLKTTHRFFTKRFVFARRLYPLAPRNGDGAVVD